MEYTENIKNLRAENKLTQADLARYLNIKQNTYSQYESGKRALPIEALIKLSALYNVSTDYILGLTKEESPYPKI